MIPKILKPFELVSALNGNTVINRNGEVVKFLRLDLEKNKYYQLTFKHGDKEFSVSLEGVYCGIEDERDVFMEATPEEETTKLLFDFLQFMKNNSDSSEGNDGRMIKAFLQLIENSKK